MGELFFGKYLVTAAEEMPEEMEVYSGWGVAVLDGKILEIGANSDLKKKYADFDVRDYRDKILMPGFTNAHMHCYGIGSHGITPPRGIDSFESFLNDFWWPLVENRIDHRMIDVSTRATAWELLNSGVTALCDVLEAPNAIPGGLDVQAAALETVGMKGVLSFEACERIDRENGRLGLAENETFFLTYREHPRISGMMCIHTTFTCSKEFIREARERTGRTGSGLQMHLNESIYEPTVCRERYGKGPVELYEELEYLGPDVLASQGVKLTEREIEILGNHGVSLVHVPLSNCEVGGGVAPVPELLRRGIEVGLGTDGYINNFFEVMRGVFLIHKAYNENPEMMPAETVLEMATAKSARAIGAGSTLPKSGKLQPGFDADIITVRPELSTPLNENNIFDQVILYCNPEHVADVFVGGVQRKQDGVLLGYNAEEMRKEVRAEAARLWEGE
mgnify:CR=1 FL=1